MEENEKCFVLSCRSISNTEPNRPLISIITFRHKHIAEFYKAWYERADLTEQCFITRKQYFITEEKPHQLIVEISTLKELCSANGDIPAFKKFLADYEQRLILESVPEKDQIPRL